MVQHDHARGDAAHDLNGLKPLHTMVVASRRRSQWLLSLPILLGK
jgi:hypothetical protein